MKEKAIGDEAQARQRLKEVVLHARDADGEMAGVCTAAAVTLPRLGQPMDMVFDRMELLVLGLTTLIFAFVALDGRSNWLEGAQLLALYVIIAVVFFFLPVSTGAASTPTPSH